MINSNLPLKDLYFNRISALIGENSDLKEINDQLDDIENISLYKENENSNIILFDYNNINKNKISFLLEKKISEKNRDNKDKKNKKRKNFNSNLEICSILSKKLFDNDSSYIILTIALKYWGIKRKIFKYDYIKRKGEYPILDDTILLYFIYYFLIFKGKIDLFTFDENKNNNIKKERENNDKTENEDEKEKIRKKRKKRKRKRKRK